MRRGSMLEPITEKWLTGANCTPFQNANEKVLPTDYVSLNSTMNAGGSGSWTVSGWVSQSVLGKPTAIMEARTVGDVSCPCCPSTENRRSPDWPKSWSCHLELSVIKANAVCT